MTTITFRTDEKLKKEASEIYENLGMSLSTALNMFMRQTVIQKKYPCSLELETMENVMSTYPNGFFELFGSGNGLGLDEEPADIQLEQKEIEL